MSVETRGVSQSPETRQASPLPKTRQASAAEAVRTTQWFVATLSWCRRHPSVIALEVLWRWAFGIPALWLVGTRVNGLLLAATGGTYDWSRLGLDHLTVVDPVGAANKLAVATSLLLPGLLDLVRRFLPGWLAAWIVVSSLGRTAVLRRADARLHARPLTMMVLQMLRLLVLGASFAVWFALLMAVGRRVVMGPVAAGEEPNLLLYFVVAILETLGLFTMWAVLSWGLSLAPLVAMVENVGAWRSLKRAFRPGALRMQLAEVNLVLGIVKIALVVLAMVFSATPLPFESVTTTEFLLWWSVGVGLIYVIASDFFHVARLVTYLDLWRRQEGNGRSQRLSR